MGKVIRNFCWHKDFVPKGLSVSALGLYTCTKSFKMCLKSYFKEIVLKLATNGQSDKGFLLTSIFVPKGLSAPALGLYTCIKALKYIPGLGVRWAFTGPLVFCYDMILSSYCNLIINNSIINLHSRTVYYDLLNIGMCFTKFDLMLEFIGNITDSKNWDTCNTNYFLWF